MQSMGPVRLKEVQAAQQFLVGTAKELAASGQIALRADADEALVE
jgi:flagellar motor switch protein FliG